MSSVGNEETALTEASFMPGGGEDFLPVTSTLMDVPPSDPSMWSGVYEPLPLPTNYTNRNIAFYSDLTPYYELPSPSSVTPSSLHRSSLTRPSRTDDSLGSTGIDNFNNIFVGGLPPQSRGRDITSGPSDDRMTTGTSSLYRTGSSRVPVSPSVSPLSSNDEDTQLDFQQVKGKNTRRKHTYGDTEVDTPKGFNKVVSLGGEKRFWNSWRRQKPKSSVASSAPIENFDLNETDYGQHRQSNGTPQSASGYTSTRQQPESDDKRTTTFESFLDPEEYPPTGKKDSSWRPDWALKRALVRWKTKEQ